ncbi:helix-turn-helix domain-containing protein [Polaribacter tangerinus]|uniref:helix-turn-helix domain-containing protein n=1 Tax=Polaribacter tangerinus TaxID=1920034 RepID=UPI000B4BB5BE|nr:helix-turn-helix domain-containing protein [Polaribacter tangerinus]
MIDLKYYNTGSAANLVEEFYSVSYAKEIVPIKTGIIPMGFSGLSFIYSDNQYSIQQKNKQILKGLTLTGQFNKSYLMCVDTEGYTCGISFKPTALYKITKLNLSKYKNKHVDFSSINSKLSKQFEDIFLRYKSDPVNLFKQIELLLSSISLFKTKSTIIIDKVIQEIHKKEGLLSVLDILEKVPFGQKTLETKFKTMIGLTPGKYIKLQRFLNLMRKFEKEQIDLKDLIYMYDYYDESHFSKDFKLFTDKTFKKYFNEEYSLIKKALKK